MDSSPYQRQSDYRRRQNAKHREARDLSKRYYEKIEIVPVLDDDTGKFKGWYVEFEFQREQWEAVEAAAARHDMTGEQMLKLLGEIALHTRPTPTFSAN